MSDDAAILQMIRILPMVEALYSQCQIAVSGGGDVQEGGNSYCVNRLNTYVQRVSDLTKDDLLDGLKLRPGSSISSVVVAAAELRSYLRQRIGLPLGAASGIGTQIYNYNAGPPVRGILYPQKEKEEAKTSEDQG